MSSRETGPWSLSDLKFARAIARVNAANPFLPERISAERAALAGVFVEKNAEWNTRPPATQSHSNVVELTLRCGVLLERMRTVWPKNGHLSKEAQALYEEVAGFWFYHQYSPRFDQVILAALEGRGEGGRVEFYSTFREEVERYLGLPGLTTLESLSAPHLFACAFQIRRAFHNIFRPLVGSSAPMAALRGAIWQSICTHNLRRYRNGLFSRMGDFATLISGPSGTGKELVARALALSRYLPYDAKRGGFRFDFSEGFFPLNLSALSPTLIESELFGHRRGAFTGALADRAGWMEVCPSTGAVFLDEIGEVETGIQVKLLRVLQARTFQPLGSTATLRFEGKVIAATNQDLPTEIRAGRFREDLYYRLCSDHLSTPSLRAQLDSAPNDLETMVAHIATRLLGEAEGKILTEEAVNWIEKHLGANYAWPGNFRELEQCVRNIVLRGEYRPAGPLNLSAESEDWNQLIASGRLTANELLRRYTRAVFSQAGTIEETARRLDVDRRTVKARLT